MADIDQLRASTLHRWNGLPSASLRPTRPWPEPYFTMAVRSDSKQTRPRWRDQTSYYTSAHPLNSRLCWVAIEGRCGDGSLRVMQCKKVLLKTKEDGQDMEDKRSGLRCLSVFRVRAEWGEEVIGSHPQPLCMIQGKPLFSHGNKKEKEEDRTEAAELHQFFVDTTLWFKARFINVL